MHKGASRDRLITADASKVSGAEFFRDLGFGMTTEQRARSDAAGRKLAARIKADNEQWRKEMLLLVEKLKASYRAERPAELLPENKDRWIA